MAQVKLENISKRFGDVEAVKELSLDIADGEFVVLVGPSGCGKSTTLRMGAGLETLSDGIIRFDGTVWSIVAGVDPGQRAIWGTTRPAPACRKRATRSRHKRARHRRRR